MDVRLVESESQSLEPTFCSKWQKNAPHKKLRWTATRCFHLPIMAVIFAAGATDNGTAQWKENKGMQKVTKNDLTKQVFQLPPPLELFK